MTNQVNENNNTSTLDLVLCLRGGKRRSKKGSKKMSTSSSKKGSKKGSKSMK